MAIIDLSHKPRGWLKWLLRAPTYLYRARLGFLFGNRFLMIEHRGRRSGRLYRTVIEVAGPRRWGVDLHLGHRALGGLVPEPPAGGLEAIWIGSPAPGSVRFPDPAEAAQHMRTYERRHPRTAARLYETMGVSYDGSQADLERMMRGIPMVAFSPAD
ncbi:MAG: hypothetical protein R2716_08080 [Microthrixaceae bacterium]